MRICQVIKKLNYIKFNNHLPCKCKVSVCDFDFKYIDTKTNKVKIINLESKYVKLPKKQKT